MFPEHSVSINTNQNYSRYMHSIAKLLKRSLRFHHSCRGALRNASQALGCHVLRCCTSGSPPWIAAYHGHLLRGTPPTDNLLAREGQILSGILFFWHPTSLCCPNSIRTAIMEIERGKKETPAILSLSPITVLFSISSSVLRMKGTGSWGHCLVMAADIPGPAPADTSLLHFWARIDRQTEVPSEVQSAGQETDHQ